MADITGENCPLRDPICQQTLENANWPDFCQTGNMTGIIVVLLVIWLVFVVLGALLEGLFWLTVVGIVLFLATGAYGWMKRKTNAG